MRLRTKFALVLVAAMLILSGVVFWSIEDFRENRLDRERGDLQRTADLAAGQLDAELNDRRNRVRFFAARPQVENFSRAGDVLGEFLNSSRFFAAWIVDRNGTVVDYRNRLLPGRRTEMIGRNLSNRTYVRAALDGATYVRAHERRDAQGLVILVSAPIGLEPANGSVDGVFVAAFRVEDPRLFGAIGPLEEEGQQHVEVTGRVVGGDRTTLYATEGSIGNNMTATATLDEVDWTVRVVRDRSDLAQQLWRLRLFQGLAIVLILVTIGGVGAWEYRTNLRQTGRLLEGFEALSAGEYDHELALAAAEEWERIAEGFNDLSAGLRERERAIRDREQRLSVLNRVLRHNLQNDLTVVRGHAEMLPDAGDEQVDRSVEEIVGMIDELMGHSRTARKIEEAMEVAEEGVVEVDAAATAERVAGAADAENPGVAVRTDVPDEAPGWAIAALESAVESLVDNAVEYGAGNPGPSGDDDADDPVVEVSVTREGEAVRVTVADDGPGIPEHERAVLGREEETALEHGSGLGLWLAHWVAEKSGGELVFGDQSDGGRATIVLAAASVDRETVEERIAGTLR